FVGLVVELAAVLKHRHDAFEGGLADRGVEVHGNAAAIVFDGARTVAIDSDGHLAGKAVHHLVDGVVDDFGDEVVHAADVAVADVHARAFADVFQVAHVAHLVDAVIARGGIAGRGGFVFFVGHFWSFSAASRRDRAVIAQQFTAGVVIV